LVCRFPRTGNDRQPSTHSKTTAPNELLEKHDERMDGGAKGEPESCDTQLETAGAFDRSSDSAREGPLVTQRPQPIPLPWTSSTILA
jgi:hypothetical protein